MRKTRKPRNTPDWRDSSSYEYTLSLSKQGWAWEFLRRNPDFRNAVRLRHPHATTISKSGSVVRIVTASAAMPFLEDWGILFF